MNQKSPLTTASEIAASVAAIIGYLAFAHQIGWWPFGSRETSTAQTRAVTATLSLVPTVTITPPTPRVVVTATPLPPMGTQTATPRYTATPTPGFGSTKISPKDGAEMVYVPAGLFKMGNDDGYSDETPVHEVYLDAFWIDKYEVTNAQFQKFVEATGYKTDAEKAGWAWAYTGSGWQQVNGANWRAPRGSGSGTADKASHPVVQVSWNDASAFCAWAGKRLPTEAEWEKAARGGLYLDGDQSKKQPNPEPTRVYPWGNTFNKDFLNSWEGGKGDTTKVGSFDKGKSPYNVMDMAGNVWEWVWDWYDANFYKNSPTRNPKNETPSQYRVLRGGSWYNNADVVRAAHRDFNVPGNRVDGVGFRCAQ